MDAFLSAVLSNAIAAALLALLVFGAGLWIRRPALLHGLWLLVFLKLLTPPIFKVGLGWSTPPATHVETPLFVPAAAERDSEGPAPAPSDGPALSARHPFWKTIPWQDLVLAIWLGGSAAWILLVAVRLRRFQRLLNSAQGPPEWLLEEARLLAVRMGLSRVPRIRLLPGAFSPMIFAFGKAVQVLLPQEALGSLPRDGVRSLLAHELAHVRRRDHWVRAIELVVSGIYWWLPVVWWARRELRRVEEQCCDAWVVWALPEKETDYAQALVHVVGLISRSSAALPPAASGIGHFSELKRRISMVMDAKTPHRLSAGARSILAALTLLVPLVPAWAEHEPTSWNSAEPARTGNRDEGDDLIYYYEKAVGQLDLDETFLKKAEEHSLASAILEDARATVAKDKAAVESAHQNLVKRAPTFPQIASKGMRRASCTSCHAAAADPSRTNPGTPLSGTDEKTGYTVRVTDEGRTLECISMDKQTVWRTQIGMKEKLFRQLSIQAGKVRVFEGNRALTFDLMTGRLQEERESDPLPLRAPRQPANEGRSGSPAEKDARPVAGKIALANGAQTKLAVDLREVDGARAGMRLEVRRRGQRIGTILIIDVQPWGSWAKPEGDLSIDQLQKGDLVSELREPATSAVVTGSETPARPLSRRDDAWSLYGQKFEGQDLVDVLKARAEIQKAKLREAELASQHADRRLEHVRVLAKKGLVAASDLLDAQNEAELCQSHVAVKQAELKEVEVMLHQAEGALRKGEPAKPR